MLEKSINDKGFGLIEHLSVSQRPQNKIRQVEDEELLGIGEPIKLKGKINASLYYQEDYLGNIISIHKEIKGSEVGLDKTNYRYLRDLADEIIQIDFFSNITNVNFIERKIFDWVINIYRDNKADFDLITFLKREIEKELMEYQFYFKIYSIGIYQEISVGKVKFTLINEDFFEREYRNTRYNYKEDTSGVFEGFMSTLVAVSSAYATSEKAFDIALSNVEDALNAIKCCMISDSLILTKTLPHLREIQSTKRNMSYMYKPQNVNKGLNFGVRFDSIPIEVDKIKFLELKKYGLEKISTFIQSRKDSELENVIMQKINDLGQIFSDRDAHERIVKLISYFESFIIPQGNLKAKGRTYMKNLITYFRPPQDVELLRCVNRMYDIRDKFLHNKIQLRIELEELFIFQKFANIFLNALIELSKKYSTVNEVLQEFNINQKV